MDVVYEERNATGQPELLKIPVAQGAEAAAVHVPTFDELLDRVTLWMQVSFPALQNSRVLHSQLAECCRICRADDEILLVAFSLLVRYLEATGPELLAEHPKESEIFYLVLLMLHLAQKICSDQPIFNGSLCRALHLRTERLLFNELRILSSVNWSFHLTRKDVAVLAEALQYPVAYIEFRLSTEIWPPLPFAAQ
ncbi:hypothetical protein PAPYR_1319 [Paratrimastix pyriformis]|uniref:Cyclin N-terminal domain-containing protein n=1 Tax=Paratrimastix pyriformis TaxID=342808 RepID=A0ABQ8UXM9_9EUKA|nr:hypothetical protein PAPYR_1319 [Paratrimastix pyriformis]